MWLYEKRLQYPVNVRKPDAKTAKIVISQLGGPNGELGAALRYLNQRYTMPYPRIQALLTDIGTEELAHVEIISTLFYQLTNGLTPQEIKVDISHILGNLITVIFDYQILRKPLKILSL